MSRTIQPHTTSGWNSGDSVLDGILTLELYEKFPDADEGSLTEVPCEETG